MIVRASVLSLLLGLLATGLLAQSKPPGEALAVHYAYAHGGTGFFSIGGKSTNVVRMPFGYGLRDADKGRWGMKLRFPLSIAFHDLDLRLPTGMELKASVETVAFTPGIEFEILLRESWQLKPYAEVGLGSEFSGDLVALIYEAGVKSLWQADRDVLQMYIGSALKYDGFRLLDEDERDAYGVAELGGELRWPAGFEIQDNAGDMGVYLIARRFLPEIELIPLRGDPTTIDSQLEVGITVGTSPRVLLWGRELPRLGLAYSWGDGLSSFQLNFGFPF
jgi:hypothetical protein